MSEQTRKISHKAIPERAEGLYYNSGLFSEVLVCHDDEALYIEHRGKQSGIVRFTFDMLEGVKIVEEEEFADSQVLPGSVDMFSHRLFRPRDVSRHDKGLLDLAIDKAARHYAHVFFLFLPQRVAGGDPIPLSDLI
jgi:hypothetical protein